jgi:hypothetical protein
MLSFCFQGSSLSARPLHFFAGGAVPVEATAEIVEIPFDKECLGCDCKVRDLTFYEERQGIGARLWHFRNYWGHFCKWCVSMARVRFPWLTMTTLPHFLLVPANKSTFVMYAVCYLSIRMEGRTHITVEQLENRKSIAVQLQELVKPNSHYTTIPLTEYVDKYPDVVVQSLDLQQLSINGSQCIGVRFLTPTGQVHDGGRIETLYPIDGRLRTQKEKDPCN